MVEAAKARFVQGLKDAGMIHPHSGQEQLVLAALDSFLEEIMPAARIFVGAEPEVAIAEDPAAALEGPGQAEEPAGSSSEKYGDGDFAGAGDPYGIHEYTDQAFQDIVKGTVDSEPGEAAQAEGEAEVE
jgi:hypothetical protein